MTENKFSSKNLAHLGILAGIFEKVKFKERIDKLMPISREKGAKLTMGERVMGMVLNALGFVDNRLYMFSEFLKEKPVGRLLGDHITAENFTDDALGRCLDAIHEYGATKLVTNITFQIASQLNLLGNTMHVDTTSLTLYGEYDNPDKKTQTPKVAYGFSKDKRGDLKQLILNLAINNKADLPMFMAAHNGNASDQKVLIQATAQIEKCCKNLASTPSFIYVADSSMYESCLKEDNNILWLSRVPMVRKEAKNFLQKHNTYQLVETSEPGYKIYSEEKIIAGVKQRWLLVFSEKALARAEKTLSKQKDRAAKAINKQLANLRRQVFNCEKDAKKTLKKISKPWKFHQVSGIEIIPIEKYPTKGRPKAETQKETIGYHMQVAIEEDTTKMRETLARKGHFILATNQLNEEELSDEEVLLEYKNQQKVERGFAFIKGNTFEVSSVFLKKESRINALMAIMVLSLFVYSLTQYLLRKTLKDKEEYIPNQLNKPIQEPTAQWVFFLFRNIQVLYINDKSHRKKANSPDLGLVINLNPLLKRITKYFGTTTMSIYGIGVSE